MTENNTLYKFYLDPDTLETLKRIKQTDGVPVAESIRRAIDMYLGARQALQDAQVVWFPNAPYQNKPQS